MPRKQKKYHFIYKTTNKLTNKFYIGMHSTDNLNDGYLGSGKRLWYSIRKYGKENHKIEILEFFETREKLRDKEIEIINEDILNDPLCINLKKGGDGGFINEEHHKKCTQAGLKSQWSNQDYIDWHKARQSMRFSDLNSKKLSNWGFKNKKHTVESKEIMRNKRLGHQNQNGEKNSQFGTQWITNGKEIKKIKRGETVPQGWRFGKK